MNQPIVPLFEGRLLKKYYPVRRGLLGKKASVKALDGISFTLTQGMTLAIVGESGCGKSTLARLLTMIEEPTEGELYYQGQNLLESNKKATALR
ncbi:MAG: ATP-binding cassette domain-containing protein, partial [Xanthomonadaceae bacterium]|nr:ATP-binding cassette domain-containing protein [Xanthomonadaceae bacterium]